MDIIYQFPNIIFLIRNINLICSTYQNKNTIPKLLNIVKRNYFKVNLNIKFYNKLNETFNENNVIILSKELIEY
jgi:hypothetical protein